MPRRSADERLSSVTILLLKSSLKTFGDAIRASGRLTSIPLSPSVPYKGEFWYEVVTKKQSAWQEFVAPALAAELNATSRTVSAVLFIEARYRRFAITFGWGRNFLKPDVIETGFGLRAVLNRIARQGIRSLDLSAYEELVLTTRKQASQSSELETFGLDIHRDLLRAATGQPDNADFGKRVSGRDSLTVVSRCTAKGLGKKCGQALDAYLDVRYKRAFAWIDHLREVRDPERLAALNEALINALRDSDCDRMHLAPPEPIDWTAVDSLRIAGTRTVEYTDLDLQRYLDELDGKEHALSLPSLKSRRVSVRFVGSSEFVNKWSLLNCVVWETNLGDQTFALVEGKWFQIDRTFARKVRAYVSEIEPPARCLPPARVGELEGVYNKRVASSGKWLAVLDGQLVRPAEAATPIEFCDLFSRDRQLFHVKRKTRSATLSHLFAQGLIGGRLLLQDEGVREQVREFLSAERPSFSRLIPKSRPSAAEFEIGYAIIANGSGFPDSLPFFSQLNLMQQAKSLRLLGFRVSLQQVREE